MAAPRPHPGAVLIQTAVGGEHVQVHMLRQRASPSVQPREECRLRAQVSRIPEQLVEHRAHRIEQELRHRRAVPTPQRVELVRNGENQVMVRAVKKTSLLPLEPILARHRLTLRTAALMARVVERALDVPRRAAAHMAAEFGGATARDPVRGSMHVQRQAVALRVRLKMLLEDSSQRAFHPPSTHVADLRRHH